MDHVLHLLEDISRTQCGILTTQQKNTIYGKTQQNYHGWKNQRLSLLSNVLF